MCYENGSAFRDELAAEILVSAIENGLFSTGSAEEKKEVAVQLSQWYKIIVDGVVSATAYEIETVPQDEHGHHHEHPHEHPHSDGHNHGECKRHHKHD